MSAVPPKADKPEPTRMTRLRHSRSEPGLLGRPFHLFPDQNGLTFPAIDRAFVGGRRNRENVTVEFEEPDLVGPRPSFVP
jgi:hypothetical protein